MPEIRKKVDDYHYYVNGQEVPFTGEPIICSVNGDYFQIWLNDEDYDQDSPATAHLFLGKLAEWRRMGRPCNPDGSRWTGEPEERDEADHEGKVTEPDKGPAQEAPAKARPINPSIMPSFRGPAAPPAPPTVKKAADLPTGEEPLSEDVIKIFHVLIEANPERFWEGKGSEPVKKRARQVMIKYGQRHQLWKETYVNNAGTRKPVMSRNGTGKVSQALVDRFLKAHDEVMPRHA